MGMRTVLTGLAGMLLGSMMPVQADMPRPTGLAADIRWTAYGVPHIRAKDERGLGYGIGYAYARDNACLLAEEIVTARGERARYFGSEGKSSAELDNLPSDIFYAWLNQPEALQAFLPPPWLLWSSGLGGTGRICRTLPVQRRPSPLRVVK